MIIAVDALIHEAVQCLRYEVVVEVVMVVVVVMAMVNSAELESLRARSEFSGLWINSGVHISQCQISFKSQGLVMAGDALILSPGAVEVMNRKWWVRIPRIPISALDFPANFLQSFRVW